VTTTEGAGETLGGHDESEHHLRVRDGGILDRGVIGRCTVEADGARGDHHIADRDRILDRPGCPDADEGVDAELRELVDGDGCRGSTDPGRRDEDLAPVDIHQIRAVFAVVREWAVRDRRAVNRSNALRNQSRPEGIAGEQREARPLDFLVVESDVVHGSAGHRPLPGSLAHAMPRG